MDIKLFQDIFQSLDDNIKFTFEEAQLERLCNGEMGKTLSFLDVALILHRDGSVETDVFYKTTNSHDYLSFDSHHPKHTRENVPYNLAKRIVVFCSNHEREKFRLSELKQWLIECGYPVAVIDRKFHNAKLQGPAPEPKNPDNVIPFVSTFYSNYKREKFRLSELKQWLIESGYPEAMIDRKFHNTKIKGPAPEPRDPGNVIPFASTYYDNYNCNNITNAANTLLRVAMV